MLHRRTGTQLLCAATFAVLALSAAGCIFGPGEDKDPPPPPPLAILPPTPPENLLKNLMTIYNDKEHSALERVNAYDSLFLKQTPTRTGFIFNFQPADIGPPNNLPPSWGLDEELEAHRGLFTAQDNGEIYLLELRMTYGAADSLDSLPEGETGWDTIFVSNVYLRLMFNPNDGLEVNGGQADFTFAPDLATARNVLPTPPGHLPFFEKYWIANWKDLPRP